KRPHRVGGAEHRDGAAEADALGGAGNSPEHYLGRRDEVVGPVVLADGHHVEAAGIGSLGQGQQLLHPLGRGATIDVVDVGQVFGGRHAERSVAQSKHLFGRVTSIASNELLAHFPQPTVISGGVEVTFHRLKLFLAEKAAAHVGHFGIGSQENTGLRAFFRRNHERPPQAEQGTHNAARLLAVAGGHCAGVQAVGRDVGDAVGAQP
nr:hypothetical protein [Tanacetum cinerariifolium]